MRSIWHALLLASFASLSLTTPTAVDAKVAAKLASAGKSQDGAAISQNNSGNAAEMQPPQRQKRPKNAKVCVVIRTYWGHGGKSKQGLRQLLSSLDRQRHKNWEGVVIVMDATPFDDLYEIVEEYENKVWVYAELVSKQYAVAASGWSHDYHGNLYILTDQAIRVCPRDTEWLLVTNGDNEYSYSLFDALEAAPRDVDLVAFDYYSRYQRSTGPPCYRFAAASNQAPCKVNRIKWCHTDLGANVFSYPRLIAENRRFEIKKANKTADNWDGILLQAIRNDWKYWHIKGQCLFDHSPSPQRCARLGGVWDDAAATDTSSSGGKCIPAASARQWIERQPSLLEIVRIELSQDGNLDKFMPNHPVEIDCLRYKDVETQRENMEMLFGPGCADDDADLPSYPMKLWNKLQANVTEHAYYVKHLLTRESGSNGTDPKARKPSKNVGWQAIPKPPPKRQNGKPKYRQKYTKPIKAKPSSKDAEMENPLTTSHQEL